MSLTTIILELDPAMAGFDIVIPGRYHRSKMEQKEGMFFVNPGSAGPQQFRLPVTVGRPRGAAGGWCGKILE